MSIQCTYKELDALRDDGVMGPVHKFQVAEPPAVTVADQVAILRFLRPIVAEIKIYEEALLKLLVQYGVRQPNKNGQIHYTIPPDKDAAYQAEKRKLDEIVCNFEGVDPLPTKYYTGKVPLSVRDLAALEKFVVLPEIAST